MPTSFFFTALPIVWQRQPCLNVLYSVLEALFFVWSLESWSSVSAALDVPSLRLRGLEVERAASWLPIIYLDLRRHIWVLLCLSSVMWPVASMCRSYGLHVINKHKAQERHTDSLQCPTICGPKHQKFNLVYQQQPNGQKYDIKRELTSTGLTGQQT